MAFSRFRTSGRRSFGTRFRPRRFSRRLNTVRRPVRWERGNFYFKFVHFHDELDVINTAVPVAMINNLIPTTFGGTGPQLAEMTRALEIGGIKFTIYQNIVSRGEPVPIPVSTGDGSTVSEVDTKVLLCSDSTFTDPGDGLAQPSALECNFFTNTAPVTRIQEIQDVQSLFPRRIHWQNYKDFSTSWVSRVEEDVGLEGTVEVPFQPQNQGVVSTHSSGNLRLRLRLQDDECLEWFFTSHVDPVAGLPLNLEVQFRVTGTLWYRYRM